MSDSTTDPSKKNISANAEDTSDLDKMLAESDPEFMKGMADLESGLRTEVATAASPALDPTVQLIDDDNEAVPPLVGNAVKDPAKSSGAWRSPKMWLANSRAHFDQLSTKLRVSAQGLKKAPAEIGARLKAHANVQTLKTLPKTIQKYGSHQSRKILDFVTNAKKLGRGQKIMVILAVVVAVGVPLSLPYLSRFFRFQSDDIIGTFEEVADWKKTFNADEEIVEFGEVDTMGNFVVLLPKIVVNIRKSANSTNNPMAALELYLEGSNQAAAVELQDRQREMVDIAQRVGETLTYDDWVSAGGKMKYKLFLRKEVNHILNKGRLKAVYFKTIFIKP